MKPPIITFLALVAAGTAEACSGTVSVTDCTLLRDPLCCATVSTGLRDSPPHPG